MLQPLRLQPSLRVRRTGCHDAGPGRPGKVARIGTAAGWPTASSTQRSGRTRTSFTGLPRVFHLHRIQPPGLCRIGTHTHRSNSSDHHNRCHSASQTHILHLSMKENLSSCTSFFRLCLSLSKPIEAACPCFYSRRGFAAACSLLCQRGALIQNLNRTSRPYDCLLHELNGLNS